MVRRADVGVNPVPVQDLTVPILRDAFRELLSPELMARAKAMAVHMSQENGVKEAASSFRNNLPLRDMVCEVSLFLDEPLVARVWCPECGLKLSVEADAVIHSHSSRSSHERHAYRFVDWGVVGPTDVASGLLQGLCGGAQEVVHALLGVIGSPIRGAVSGGAWGAMQGLATGMVNLVKKPLRGGVIFIDKVNRPCP